MEQKSLNAKRLSLSKGLAVLGLALILGFGFYTFQRPAEIQPLSGAAKLSSSSTELVIYTKPTCPYCLLAKQLLEEKGLSYTEIDLLRYPERRSEMLERAQGASTVPQIFIGSLHVGGFSQLLELEAQGRLDALLGGGPRRAP